MCSPDAFWLSFVRVFGCGFCCDVTKPFAGFVHGVIVLNFRHDNVRTFPESNDVIIELRLTMFVIEGNGNPFSSPRESISKGFVWVKHRKNIYLNISTQDGWDFKVITMLHCLKR